MARKASSAYNSNQMSLFTMGGGTGQVKTSHTIIDNLQALKYRSKQISGSRFGFMSSIEGGAMGKSVKTSKARAKVNRKNPAYYGAVLDSGYYDGPFKAHVGVGGRAAINSIRRYRKFEKDTGQDMSRYIKDSEDYAKKHYDIDINASEYSPDYKFGKAIFRGTTYQMIKAAAPAIAQMLTEASKFGGSKKLRKEKKLGTSKIEQETALAILRRIREDYMRLASVKYPRKRKNPTLLDKYNSKRKSTSARSLYESITVSIYDVKTREILYTTGKQ